MAKVTIYLIVSKSTDAVACGRVFASYDAADAALGKIRRSLERLSLIPEEQRHDDLEVSPVELES